jgi:hypothetical protein
MQFSKATFERMFRGKEQVPYKLSVAGQDYMLNVRYTWKGKFFQAFADKFGSQLGKKINTPGTFEADPKSYGQIMRNIGSTIQKIQKTEGKKLKGLVFLNANMKGAVFKREGDRIVLYITIEGLCKYDN